MSIQHYKTERITARIEPNIKVGAERIFRKMGISPAEAMRIFYNQVYLGKRMPFDIKVPNTETQKAMRDVEEGRTTPLKSIAALIEELKAEDEQ